MKKKLDILMKVQRSGQRECEFFEWANDEALGTEMTIVIALLNQLSMKEKDIVKLEKKNRKLKLEIESLIRVKKLLIWLMLIGIVCYVFWGLACCNSFCVWMFK